MTASWRAAAAKRSGDTRLSFDVNIGDRDSRHTVVRNTVYNLVTQGLLVVSALAAVPMIVRGLGTERFGLLSLIWVLVGYFSLLDLGMSRANAKFLAEAIAVSDEREMRRLVWTSLCFGLGVGLFTGILMAALAPWAVHSLLNLSGDLADQAVQAFLVAAVGLPFVVVFGVVRGIQTAFQRFGLINLFQGTIGVVQWFGAALLVWLGVGFNGVILLTVLVRIIVSLGSLLTIPRMVPRLFAEVRLWDPPVIRKLLGYGGWVTVAQVIGPLDLYLDRVLIGALLSLAAVTYYTVPQEALMRLLIIPISLTATLFPVISGQSALPSAGAASSALYSRAVKYLLLIMLPLLLALVAVAPWVLTLWMGRPFADIATSVFQVLAIGMVFNSLAQVPVMALQAYGRPDIPAKMYVAELPLLVGLNLLLIPRYGIMGAAAAFTLRSVVDALFLFFFSHRSIHISLQSLGGPSGQWGIAGHFLFAAAALADVLLLPVGIPRVALLALCTAAYGYGTWRLVLDDTDRAFFLNLRWKFMRTS